MTANSSLSSSPSPAHDSGFSLSANESDTPQEGIRPGDLHALRGKLSAILLAAVVPAQEDPAHLAQHATFNLAGAPPLVTRPLLWVKAMSGLVRGRNGDTDQYDFTTLQMANYELASLLDKVINGVAKGEQNESELNSCARALEQKALEVVGSNLGLGQLERDNITGLLRSGLHSLQHTSNLQDWLSDNKVLWSDELKVARDSIGQGCFWSLARLGAVAASRAFTSVTLGTGALIGGFLEGGARGFVAMQHRSGVIRSWEHAASNSLDNAILEILQDSNFSAAVTLVKEHGEHGPQKNVGVEGDRDGRVLAAARLVQDVYRTISSELEYGATISARALPHWKLLIEQQEISTSILGRQSADSSSVQTDLWPSQSAAAGASGIDPEPAGSDLITKRLAERRAALQQASEEAIAKAQVTSIASAAFFGGACGAAGNLCAAIASNLSHINIAQMGLQGVQTIGVRMNEDGQPILELAHYVSTQVASHLEGLPDPIRSAVGDLVAGCAKNLNVLHHAWENLGEYGLNVAAAMASAEEEFREQFRNVATDGVGAVGKYFELKPEASLAVGLDTVGGEYTLARRYDFGDGDYFVEGLKQALEIAPSVFNFGNMMLGTISAFWDKGEKSEKREILGNGIEGESHIPTGEGGMRVDGHDNPQGNELPPAAGDDIDKDAEEVSPSSGGWNRGSEGNHGREESMSVAIGRDSGGSADEEKTSDSRSSEAEPLNGSLSDPGSTILDLKTAKENLSSAAKVDSRFGSGLSSFSKQIMEVVTDAREEILVEGTPLGNHLTRTLNVFDLDSLRDEIHEEVNKRLVVALSDRMEQSGLNGRDVERLTNASSKAFWDKLADLGKDRHGKADNSVEAIVGVSDESRRKSVDAAAKAALDAAVDFLDKRISQETLREARAEADSLKDEKEELVSEQHASEAQIKKLISETMTLKQERVALDDVVVNLHQREDELTLRLEKAEAEVAEAKEKLEFLPKIQQNVQELQTNLSELTSSPLAGRPGGTPGSTEEDLSTIIDSAASELSRTLDGFGRIVAVRQQEEEPAVEQLKTYRDTITGFTGAIGDMIKVGLTECHEKTPHAEMKKKLEGLLSTPGLDEDLEENINKAIEKTDERLHKLYENYTDMLALCLESLNSGLLQDVLSRRAAAAGLPKIVDTVGELKDKLETYSGKFSRLAECNTEQAREDSQFLDELKKSFAEISTTVEARKRLKEEQDLVATLTAAFS